MSYTSVGRNKVYASIEDLPQNQKIVNGDRILIQTDEGTALVDYEDIKIDLGHTTFGTQITSLIEFTSTVQAFVDTMQSEFLAIKDETVTMKNNINQIQQQMECCKLLFKYIMGAAQGESNNTITKQVQNTLSGAGRTMFDECMDAVKIKELTFTFRDWNLIS